MNRIKYKITLPSSTTTEHIYKYDVLLATNTIYKGKLFVMPNKTSIELDLTDLLTNYQYKGQYMLEPVYDYDKQCYVRNVSSNTTQGMSLTQLHRNTVKVKVYDDNGNTIVTTSRTIYFHTTPFENQIRKTTNNNGVNYYFGSMIPRFPFGSSMSYTQLVDSDNGGGTILWNSNKNILITATAKYDGCILKAKVETDIYDGNLKILEVDKCNAPYYLMYLTQDGGFQSQPFYNVKYSETYTTNTKITVDDNKDIANLFANGKWTLKSRNLTNTEYHEMMDIARSPYLYLYITALDKGVFVNNIDTTIEKKVNGVDNNKPIFFEINLESREQQLNIF